MTALEQWRQTKIDFEWQLRGVSAIRFIKECESRDRTPAELVADILEAVIRDDLYAAVLDE